MQAKCLVTLNPFPVPESVTLAPKVRKTEAAPPVPGVPYVQAPREYWEILLADLDAETLHRLCEEFRDSVFFRAGKKWEQPPEPALPEIDKDPAFRALNLLRAVLCDPEGAVCVTGKDKDREVVAEALDALSNFLVFL